MDNKQAIKKLRSQRDEICNGCLHAVGWCESHCGFSEAIEMAIEALKAQLSQEGTTFDLISRTETLEHLRRVLDATVPVSDYDEGYVDGVEFGISTVSTMPTVQPVATDTNVGNNSEIPNSSDAISRQAAIDALKMDISMIPFAKAREYVRAAIETIYNRLEELPRVQPETHEERTETHACDCISRQQAIDGKISIQLANGVEIYSDEAVLVEYLKNLPPAQPEPQWVPVSERMPSDGTWNIFTDGKNISVERYKADAIDHFFPNGRWFQLEDAIAWMPLPEPYKGGEKDE